MLRYILSLSFVLWTFLALAQGKKSSEDSLKMLRPSSVPSFRLGANLVAPVRTFLSKKYVGVELSAELWGKKGYALVAEGGYASRTRLDEDYQTRGIFMRLGFDYGFWSKNPIKNPLGTWQIGVRLCASSFNYEYRTVISNSYWTPLAINTSGRGKTALWLEVPFSLRAKIGKYLYLGPFLKTKLLLSASQDAILGKLADIPGYGISNTLQAEAGYWIFWKF